MIRRPSGPAIAAGIAVLAALGVGGSLLLDLRQARCQPRGAGGTGLTTAGQANPIPEAGPVDVSFVGDSITAWSDWQAAFPSLRVVNQGIGGDTSIDLIERLASLRRTQAATYLLMVGINDIKSGYAPTAIAERILWLHAELARPTPDGRTPRVIVQSTILCTAPLCDRADVERVRVINRHLRHCLPPDDFLDLNGVLADADGLKPEFTTDGIHLNGAGYGAWVDVLRRQRVLPSPQGAQPGPPAP